MVHLLLSTSLCAAFFSTAVAEKGSVNVVPPYQAGQWSMKYGLKMFPDSPVVMFSVLASRFDRSAV
jgi:hypothetical protein